MNRIFDSCSSGKINSFAQQQPFLLLRDEGMLHGHKYGSSFLNPIFFAKSLMPICFFLFI
jgi:hypothetical protein